ncbi:uncharacterized protein LOC111192581 [Astyanax mexicanus]|uniref:uncharacterized protein LOC111192581 n=1 Tax=Astyanax mexicanus TaxID=7994 RepID=UPI0020CB56C6|nr:uncharacterized protein LOC111192581 [Astyanax mexicanus]
MLNDFFLYCVGSNPSSKVKDNGNTCRSHVRRFLLFSGEGQLLRGDFAFLKEAKVVSDWVQVLKEDGMKPTTIRVNLINIRKFVLFLKDQPVGVTKVSDKAFDRLLSQLKQRLRDLHRDVTIHRQKIRKAGRRNIVPIDSSKAFRKKARRILPMKLKRDSEVFGLLAGYFISLSGHRTGVMENMLMSEVREAELEDNRSIIEVQSHKSAGTYGHAQVSVNEKEYSWFMSLLDMRDNFEGSDSPYFFFSASGGKCRKLVYYFQKEWKKMGLKGSFTFRNLRTSVVHYTKDLSPSKKAAVHRQMCHSEAVAAKFYLPLNTADEAAQVRKLQEGSSETSSETSKKTVQETSQDSSQEISLESSQETSRESSRESSQETSRESSQETSRESSQETSEETSPPKTSPPTSPPKTTPAESSAVCMPEQSSAPSGSGQKRKRSSEEEGKLQGKKRAKRDISKFFAEEPEDVEVSLDESGSSDLEKFFVMHR